MKSSSVKVSVIMPAYNAAASIDQAVQSVLSQKGVVFELLVGDDGSTDETWERIQCYRTNPRLKAFRFLRNRGAAATGNRLVARARGQYIFSCDADDWILPDALRCLSGALDKHRSFGVAYGNLVAVSRSGRRRLKRRLIVPQSWDLLGGFFANGGTLIRASLMKKIGGYRTQLPYLEDCDLFLRLAEHTRFFYLSGKPLYCQTRRAGSLSDQSVRNLKKISRKLLRDAIQRRYEYAVRW